MGRELRETNIIGALVPPPMIAQKINGRTLQYVRGKQSNEFVDYIEQPLSTRYHPTVIELEDNTGDSKTKNDITLNVTYGNLLDYFSNNGLNNRLATPEPNLYDNSLHTVFEYVTSSQMSTVITYAERIYPAEINAYRNVVRRRTEFTIDDIWNPDRDQRSVLGGQVNSQGYTVANASIWPLDAHSNFAKTSSVIMTDGAGELMNSYSRWGDGVTCKILAAPTYAARVPCGSSSVDGNPVRGGDAMWEAGTQAGKQPYETYEDYSEYMSRVGKDHSIIPEFRLSSLIEDYVETYRGLQFRIAPIVISLKPIQIPIFLNIFRLSTKRSMTRGLGISKSREIKCR